MDDMLAANLAFLLRGDKAAQTAIADKIGVSQPTISKWSRLEQTGSISEPEFRKMARLARVLNVSLEDLAWRDLRREPPRAPSQDSGLDVSKLAGLIEAIEATARDADLELDPRFKARVIAAYYANSGEEPLTAQAIRTALTAVMKSLEEQ